MLIQRFIDLLMHTPLQPSISVHPFSSSKNYVCIRYVDDTLIRLE